MGLALALGLARQGVASIVLERRTHRTSQPKAAGILPRTLEMFAAWGVLEDFKREGVYQQEVNIWSADRDVPLLHIDLRNLAPMTDQTGVLFIPQFRTEELLEGAALQTGLVDIRHGHTVVDVIQNHRDVQLDVSTETGAYYSLYGSYVVGCDGMSSVVRHKLRVELEGTTYPQRMWLADVMVDDERDALPSPRFIKTPQGRMVALRLGPHMWRLLAAAAASDDKNEVPSKGFAQERATQALGPGPVRCLWQDTFSLHSRVSPTWRRGRILLAGDAAHVNSPAGGQGMNCGIHDAHNLAWKLAQAVRRNGNAPALLRSYEVERREAFVSTVQKTSHLLTRLTIGAGPMTRMLFLAAARLILHWPWARQRLLTRLGMFDARYKDSPMLLGNHPLIGKRAPQTSVINTSGDACHSYDHSSQQAALLFFDDRGNVQQDAVLRAATLTVKNVRMWRITRNKNLIQYPGGVLWDADGHAWRDWHAQGGMVALVRPDGVVGWVSYKIPTTVAATCAMMWHALGLRSHSHKSEHRRLRHHAYKAQTNSAASSPQSPLRK